MRESIAVMLGAPLDGFTPDDIREWLEANNNSDMALADAKSAVGGKVGWLHHEVNDPDNDEKTLSKYRAELLQWWELDKELVAEIKRRLEIQNITQGTNHTVTAKGYHYEIAPFMNQNGYRDGSGWWVKNID